MKIFLPLLLLLNACVYFPENNTAKPIVIENNSRLTFSGKGAGAGMMLSASMGAMGVALGIAIDEGIAKDIAATAQNGGVHVEAVLQQQLAQANISLPADTVITIDRYGFIILPGDGEQTAAQLHITLTSPGNQQAQEIRFPEGFAKAEAIVVAKALLSDIKTDAAVISSLWGSAAAALVSVMR